MLAVLLRATVTWVLFINRAVSVLTVAALRGKTRPFPMTMRTSTQLHAGGTTDSGPVAGGAHQRRPDRVSVVVAAVAATCAALSTTLLWARPAAAVSVDISGAMGSFGGVAASVNGTVTSSGSGNAGGATNPAVTAPPATLSQFLVTPGTRQADPLTHGF